MASGGESPDLSDAESYRQRQPSRTWSRKGSQFSDIETIYPSDDGEPRRGSVFSVAGVSNVSHVSHVSGDSRGPPRRDRDHDRRREHRRRRERRERRDREQGGDGDGADKKESAEKKEGEDEEGGSNWLKILLGFLVVIGFYGVLTVIIIELSPNTAEEKKQFQDFVDNSTCMANSFLLRDGTCDVIANTPRCLYDGNDCCLPIESLNKMYCGDDCVCFKDVSNYKEKLRDFGVEKYEVLPHTKKIYKLKHFFENVADEMVCTLLCIEENELHGSDVNSWSFFITNPEMGYGECKCYNIPKFCRNYFGDGGSPIRKEITADVTMMVALNEFKDSDLRDCLTVVIAGGVNRVHDVDVIDLNSTETFCTKMFPLEETYNEATGGLVTSAGGTPTPIFCGGLEEMWTYTKKCHVLWFGNETNTDDFNIQIARGNAASIVVGENSQTLFITGGMSSPWNTLDSTEYLTLATLSSEWGPPMPDHVWGHCFVKVNDTFAISAGGTDQTGFPIAKTNFFDIEAKVWTIGPDLKTPRDSHSCEAIITTTTEEVVVAAVGGVMTDHGSRILNSLEIFSGENPDRWTPATPATVQLANSAFLPSIDRRTLFLIGGFRSFEVYDDIQSTILKLTCMTKTTCNWQPINSGVEIKRWGHVAIGIPVSGVECYFPEPEDNAAMDEGDLGQTTEEL